MYGAKIPDKKFGKMVKTTYGRSRLGQKDGQAGRSPDFGTCEAKKGTETDELLQTGTDGHQRVWQNVEEKSNFGRW